MADLIKISDSTSTTSSVIAASSTAVKTVMDTINNVSATANAAYNASLICKSTNPITNPSDDTTHNWANLGAGVYWFTGSADKLIDQPQGYGMLINIVVGADIFQIWSSQNSGPVRFRQGNYSGWGNTWQNTATWADNCNWANGCATATSNNNFVVRYASLLNGPGTNTINNYTFPTGGTWRYMVFYTNSSGSGRVFAIGEVAGGTTLDYDYSYQIIAQRVY